MNIPQKVAMAAILFGAQVLAGHPVLAVAADPGSETPVFAQVQGQQDEQATSGQPADQPAARRGMGAGMMGGGDGMMDPQMMMRMMRMHGGMDSGMTGGMGPMGPCPMLMARADKDFSAEQVRDILEGQLAWTGNKRLKVGGVERKDEETYVAEIVTVDDSLVQRLEVTRSTGAMRPID